jgi:hypothetical protein
MTLPIKAGLVILSAAKDLGVRPGRPFAALRMTRPALKGKTNRIYLNNGKFRPLMGTSRLSVKKQ